MTSVRPFGRPAGRPASIKRTEGEAVAIMQRGGDIGRDRRERERLKRQLQQP